jgi:hypothetical protein
MRDTPARKAAAPIIARMPGETISESELLSDGRAGASSGSPELGFG